MGGRCGPPSTGCAITGGRSLNAQATAEDTAAGQWLRTAPGCCAEVAYEDPGKDAVALAMDWLQLRDETAPSRHRATATAMTVARPPVISDVPPAVPLPMGGYSPARHRDRWGMLLRPRHPRSMGRCSSGRAACRLGRCSGHVTRRRLGGCSSARRLPPISACCSAVQPAADPWPACRPRPLGRCSSASAARYRLLARVPPAVAWGMLVRPRRPPPIPGPRRRAARDHASRRTEIRAAIEITERAAIGDEAADYPSPGAKMGSCISHYADRRRSAKAPRTIRTRAIASGCGSMPSPAGLPADPAGRLLVLDRAPRRAMGPGHGGRQTTLWPRRRAKSPVPTARPGWDRGAPPAANQCALAERLASSAGTRCDPGRSRSDPGAVPGPGRRWPVRRAGRHLGTLPTAYRAQ